jgi:hypothetical protein
MSHPVFPERVTIWKEGALSVIDFASLREFLLHMRRGLAVDGPVDVWAAVREGGETPSISRTLACSRVFRMDRARDPSGSEPLPAEIRVEERMVEGLAEPVGMLYDANELTRSYARAIEAARSGTLTDPGILHVVITYRLIGTFEPSDRRYHARTSLYALPCVISTTGLVVAPAKPREYYLAKSFLPGLATEESLRALSGGRVLDHDDERTTDIVKGYLLQALFYHATGNPFCEDPSCRLYNAHWQEDMLRAQLAGEYDLCPAHEKMLAAPDRQTRVQD